MHYRLLYDGSGEIPGIALPIIGALVACFCSLLWVYRDQIFSRKVPESASRGKRILLFFLIGSLLFTPLSAIATYQAWRDGPHRLAEGRLQVVEGVVEDFVPIRSHDTERFTVRGIHFSYADDILGQGFNRSSGQSGPIRNGVRVRIHYAWRPCGGGCADIWKLEIAE